MVDYPVNRGYGGALRAGFERALTTGAEAIFLMDSDGQFDIAELAGFLPLLVNYDGVFGYRINRQDPFLRKLNTWAWRQLVRAVFRIRARDIDCAFKLLRADFVRHTNLEATGAMFSTELLARFARAGLRFAEVGVRHYPRNGGKPTGAQPMVILRAFKELWFLRPSIMKGPSCNTSSVSTENTKQEIVPD